MSTANLTSSWCQMAANEHNANMCNLFDECSVFTYFWPGWPEEIYFTITGRRSGGLHMDKDENTQEPAAHSELTGRCYQFVWQNILLYI